MEKTQVNTSQHNRFHMHMQKRKGGYRACSSNNKTLQTFEPLVSGEQTHLRRWEISGSEYLQIPIQQVHPWPGLTLPHTQIYTHTYTLRSDGLLIQRN